MNETNWISVGDLGKSFAESSNALRPVADLAGHSYDIDFGFNVVTHAFIDDKTLTWTVKGTGESGTDAYQATSPRPGIYFVDFIKSSVRATSVSLVLDLQPGIATVVIGTLPDEASASIPAIERVRRNRELTAVDAQIFPGVIDGRFDAESPTHEATAELVGKRVQYRYNPHECYEHVYLNEEMYVWHCVSGIEKGLADADRCHYRKIRDGLYLFVWREKTVPTLGVIMIDLDAGKTTGKILGYAGDDFGELANFPVGAYATVLNTTEVQQ
ncbi:molybdenum cofactor biosynthesis F family protein [Trinickia dinghuensis]|uniref:Molybdenum cofactor biosynthesis protein F n=1 Tax=Trinickia dinghuensis TaxID=2291023 RepID=A0A3D8K2L7_9BURK|nr:molybdenum cofactor biosynthesis F family protein [Trinickia dinghuensis]RDU98811.1 molybdenum cofactor biosynthesis protein F [Trinickia dinghuensis]